MKPNKPSPDEEEPDQKPPKPKSDLGSSSKKKSAKPGSSSKGGAGRAASSGKTVAGRPPRESAPSPPNSSTRIAFFAIGGFVAAALVVVAILAARSGPEPQVAASPEPSPEVRPSIAPSIVPTRMSDVPLVIPSPDQIPGPRVTVVILNDDQRFKEAAAKGKDLVGQGRYAEARHFWTEFLKEAKGDLVGAAKFELEAVVRLEKMDQEARALTESLDQAGDDASKHDPALVALATWWRKRVDERGLPPMMRVTKRLLEDRHARLEREAGDASKRLEAAKAALAERKSSGKPAPSSDSWAKRLECAKKDKLDIEVKDKQGKSGLWKGLVITGLDAKGFTLASPTRKLALEWTERPALSLQIRGMCRREAGADRADDLFQDARFAMSLKRDDLAKPLFAERSKLTGAPEPDLEKIRAARPFVVKPAVAADGTARFAYAFEDESERADFAMSSVEGVKSAGSISVENGALVMRDNSPFATVQLAKDLDVGPGLLEVSGELNPVEVGPFLAADYLHDDGSRTTVQVSVEWGKNVRVLSLLSRPRPRPKAGDLVVPELRTPPAWVTCHEGPLEAKRPVLVRIAVTPGSGAVDVTLDGKKVAWSAGAPAVPATTLFTPRVGKLSGPLGTYKKISFAAPLRAGWLRKLEQEYERVLAQELGGTGARKGVALPQKTSADDAVASAGLPEAAVASYNEARDWLAKGDEAKARAALDAAALSAAPYPAALLLRASLDVETDPHRALEDSEQILAFLPDCHEALALRGFAWANLGQGERARADIAQVLALRSDAALAYLARGMIGLQERKPEEPASGESAVADLELASALAPGDPVFEKKAALGIAVLKGPWPDGSAKRKITEHYVIATDTEQASLESIAKDLEEAWARYAKRFPIKGAWRRAEVLVFNTRGGYEDWAGTFSPDLAKHADGYYDPVYDQLVLFEPVWDRTHLRTRDVTFHEAFHQYARRALPHMPDWLNEGLAMWFGIDAAYDGRPDHEKDPLRKCLARPFGLEGWAKFLVGTHEDFQDSKHEFALQHENYGRAWVVAILLTEGSGHLQGVLERLLARLETVPSLNALIEIFDDRTLQSLDTQFRRKATELAR